MSTILFVTGTDTGVGKTLVTSILLKSLIDKGTDSIAFKPVQTGCGGGDDDAAWIRSMTGANEAIVPPQFYRLAFPASPYLAAREEGVAIDFNKIVTTIHQLAARHEVVLVEGAGGLLVPLDQHHSLLDLILAIGADVILVSRNALGTLNHTALTLRELRRNKVNIAAVFVNEVTQAASDDEKRIRTDNIDQIKELAASAPVIALTFNPTLTPESIGKLSGTEPVRKLCWN